MAELKTRQTDQSVAAFLDAIPDEGRRADCRTVSALMREVTGEEPRMWGENIVGFGAYRYTYESGRSGEWFVCGFSPRKQNLTLYLGYDLAQHQDLLSRLGKHSTGKACLYLKSLAAADLDALRELIARTVARHRSAE